MRSASPRVHEDPHPDSRDLQLLWTLLTHVTWILFMFVSISAATTLLWLTSLAWLLVVAKHEVVNVCAAWACARVADGAHLLPRLLTENIRLPFEGVRETNLVYRSLSATLIGLAFAAVAFPRLLSQEWFVTGLALMPLQVATEISILRLPSARIVFGTSSASASALVLTALWVAGFASFCAVSYESWVAGQLLAAQLFMRYCGLQSVLLRASLALADHLEGWPGTTLPSLGYSMACARWLQASRCFTNAILSWLVLRRSEAAHWSLSWLLLCLDASDLGSALCSLGTFIARSRELAGRFIPVTAEEISQLAPDDACAVCLAPHSQSQTRRLPCSHLLHAACLAQLTDRGGEAGGRCPVCRAQFLVPSSARRVGTAMPTLQLRAAFGVPLPVPVSLPPPVPLRGPSNTANPEQSHAFRSAAHATIANLAHGEGGLMSLHDVLLQRMHREGGRSQEGARSTVQEEQDNRGQPLWRLEPRFYGRQRGIRDDDGVEEPMRRVGGTGGGQQQQGLGQRIAERHAEGHVDSTDASFIPVPEPSTPHIPLPLPPSAEPSFPAETHPHTRRQKRKSVGVRCSEECEAESLSSGRRLRPRRTRRAISVDG